MLTQFRCPSPSLVPICLGTSIFLQLAPSCLFVSVNSYSSPSSRPCSDCLHREFINVALGEITSSLLLLIPRAGFSLQQYAFLASYGFTLLYTVTSHILLVPPPLSPPLHFIPFLLVCFLLLLLLLLKICQFASLIAGRVADTVDRGKTLSVSIFLWSFALLVQVCHRPCLALVLSCLVLSCLVLSCLAFSCLDFSSSLLIQVCRHSGVKAFFLS